MYVLHGATNRVDYSQYCVVVTHLQYFTVLYLMWHRCYTLEWLMSKNDWNEMLKSCLWNQAGQVLCTEWVSPGNWSELMANATYISYWWGDASSPDTHTHVHIHLFIFQEVSKGYLSVIGNLQTVDWKGNVTVKVNKLARFIVQTAQFDFIFSCILLIVVWETAYNPCWLCTFLYSYCCIIFQPHTDLDWQRSLQVTRKGQNHWCAT